MNNTKLSFAVDASQIDIKPLLRKDFLELSMKAISDANPNRNNTWFTLESMEASKDTFRNKPILGYFENGDFVSHNGEWVNDPETNMDYWDTLGKKGERILGLIRSEDEVKIIQDKNGLNWIYLSCALWTQYSFKQVKRLLKDAKRAKANGGAAKNISVEVDITDYEILPNGIMKINAFNLIGITILGSRNGVKVEPGIEDAELSVVDIMGRDLYEKQARSLRLAYEKLNNKNGGIAQMNDTKNILVAEDQDIEVQHCEEEIKPEEVIEEHCEETFDDSQLAMSDEVVAKVGEIFEGEEQPNEEHCEDEKCEDHDEEDEDDEEEHCEEGQCEEGHCEEAKCEEEAPVAEEEPECNCGPECNCKLEAEELHEEENSEMKELQTALGNLVQEHTEFVEKYNQVCNDYESSLAKIKELEAENKRISEELGKYQLAEFVESAKSFMKSFDLPENIITEYTVLCEKGEITSIDDLKVKIALESFGSISHLASKKAEFEASAVETEKVDELSQSVAQPNTNYVFTSEAKPEKKTKQSILRDYIRK